MTSRIIGWIDVRHRPLINLTIPEKAKPVPALVDTGFTGQLLTDWFGADAFSWHPTGLFEQVEAVGGSPLTVIAQASIFWRGSERTVTMDIIVGDPPPRRGDPVAIIGTELLASSRVVDRFRGTTYLD
jgi:predicted aspartyl protease